MKIGIDARLLSTKIRGTARYLKNILEYIPKFDNENEYFVFQYEDLPTSNDFYEYIKIKKSILPRQVYEHYWLNFVLPKLIKKIGINIFFTPYVFVPFRKSGWKNVIAIHDALTKVCKEYYTLHYRKYMDILVPESIKRSDHIITVSESAKKDIVKFYKSTPEKITSLHLWTDEKFRPLSIDEENKNQLINKYHIPETFILFVSVLEERKNLGTLIKVSDNLWNRGIKIKFVLIGREGFGFEKFRSEFQARKNRILILSEIEDKDLVLIYNLAKVFIFPTFYEGFGLPPLEAMKCGTPVVASNNSSMPEVVGEGGILGDANDHKFYTESIIKLLKDEDFYAEMKAKALKQASKFTAKAHLTKLIDIFNNL
ncbi:MAG: glycosyltransferase family 4 protein [Bacteroidales bacterium]